MGKIPFHRSPAQLGHKPQPWSPLWLPDSRTGRSQVMISTQQGGADQPLVCRWTTLVSAEKTRDIVHVGFWLHWICWRPFINPCSGSLDLGWPLGWVLGRHSEASAGVADFSCMTLKSYPTSFPLSPGHIPTSERSTQAVKSALITV